MPKQNGQKMMNCNNRPIEFHCLFMLDSYQNKSWSIVNKSYFTLPNMFLMCHGSGLYMMVEMDVK